MSPPKKGFPFKKRNNEKGNYSILEKMELTRRRNRRGKNKREGREIRLGRGKGHHLQDSLPNLKQGCNKSGT